MGSISNKEDEEEGEKEDYKLPTFKENMETLGFDEELFGIEFRRIDVLKVDSKLVEGGNEVYFVDLLCKYKGKECRMRLFREDRYRNPESYKLLMKIFQDLKVLKHPNIPEFIGGTLESPRIGYLQDYYSKRIEVQEIISSVPHVRDFPICSSTPFKLKMLLTVADLFIYLKEKHNLFHCFPTWNDFYFCHDGKLKIKDIGHHYLLSNIILKDGVHYLFNIYASPEKKSDPRIMDEKSNVWQFGFMMYELLTYDVSYFKRWKKEEEKEEEKDAYCSTTPGGQRLVHKKPPIDEHPIAKEKCLEWMFEMMKRCWCVCRADRPTFNEIRDVIKKNLEDTEDGIQEYDRNQDEKIQASRRQRELLMKK